MMILVNIGDDNFVDIFSMTCIRYIILYKVYILLIILLYKVYILLYKVKR